MQQVRRVVAGLAGTAVVAATAVAGVAVLDLPADAATTVTVAADGSARYRTVQAAIDAVQAGNSDRVVVSIKPGTYREIVTIPANKPFVTLQGTGSAPDQVLIVNNHAAAQYGTFNSATMFVRGHDSVLTNLTVSNDLDETKLSSGQQAVALHLNADRSVLDRVRLLGDQDTFLVNNDARAYLVDSYVEGTVDFVFGGGTLVAHRTTVHEKRSSGGPLTAASTLPERAYGFLFYRSTITGANTGKTTLGRPWRQSAQVLFRESRLNTAVRTAEPWTDMSGNTWQRARFLEYRNTGPGATTNSKRPQLPDAKAADHTPQKYLAGRDGWNPVRPDAAGAADQNPSAAGTSADPLQATGVPAAAPVASSCPGSDRPDGFASTGGGTTGGAGGETVTVSTFDDLVRYATASGRYVVRVKGAITVSPKGYEIPVTSDKTVVGVGTSGQLVQGGIVLRPGVHNVIIRNLTIRDAAMPEDDPDDKQFDYDGIQMDTADHVWIDHNRITNMNDGLIDSRKDTSYLTVSWNELSNEHKAFGIGWTPNVTARMTLHHNWLHGTDTRNPSTDNVAFAHLYNNYLQDITGYGNYARGRTKMVLENSYFDGVQNPYYPDPDAELRQSGSVVVKSRGKQQTRGAAFAPSDFYAYRLDKAADLPALLRACAGPQPWIGG